MNALYRYLIKITSCLGLWILISPGLGMAYDAASAQLPSEVGSGQPADQEVRIVYMKPAAASPNNQVHHSGNIRSKQHSHAKKHVRHNGSQQAKKSVSAKTQKKSEDSKHAQPSVANPKSSDVSVPVKAAPLPKMEYKIETPAIQEPIITEPMMYTGQTPLLAGKTWPQPLNDDNAPPVSKKDDEIRTVSKIPASEYAPQQNSIHDTVSIIARLLLKFSLITISCISLFFSFSALQIAKSNQRIRCRVGEENGTR